MAGIGFELRKLMRKDTIGAILRAYSYAGLISSGPWVISILGILVLGILTFIDVIPHYQITQFQTSVTYLIASSLILSGLLQHSFTRYISDQLFLRRYRLVLPSFHGALLMVTLVSGVIGLLCVLFLFPEQSVIYRILMNAGFVILCNIWVATNLLSGLKAYRSILITYAVAYTGVISIGYLLRTFGLEGLLFGFITGHVFLLAGLLYVIYKEYPSPRLMDLTFAQKGRMFKSLVLTGLFYNLGVWVDKFVFWFSPETGQQIIGPLHSSLIYDLPIFLAYLSVIPGMAVFLVRMETDFVEYYDKFYNAVRDGGSLSLIKQLRNEMLMSAKDGVFDIIKIQSIAVFLTFVLGPMLLAKLGISKLYLHLLYIDVVGAGLQVVFLGLLNVFFYLDKRKRALMLTVVFTVTNLIFSFISIKLGVFFFGYGFVMASLVSIMVAMKCLDRDFEHLEYETFMLQEAV